MMKSKNLGLLGVVGALVASGYGHEVVAQGRNRLHIGGSTSNFGNASLASGFVPDPHDVDVTSGGNIDVRTQHLGTGCVGYLTANPDFILHLTSTSPHLRIYVTAPGDTTLVINDASSHWRCNDDSYGGDNPTVDINNAGAGQYDIWIGSYSSSAQITGQLHITEEDNHP